MERHLQPTALRRHPALCAFLLSFLAAAALFLPFGVVDKGFFLYCGDFNSQQIPFYQYCQQFVRSGGGSFSWATDLGSGFLNSYSFYTLGSPFFWLSCLLPNSWLPYAMVPLLCLKFGIGGAGAFLWARRYTKTTNGALLASALFTLSGWGIYNIFFNHFIDCMVLFPYLLAALDAFVYDKQRAVLPLAVAVNLLCNYFFFLGQALFAAIYFFIKLAAGDYRMSLKEFFLLAFEVAVGCLLGCVLIFPAAASLLQNPRTTTHANGYGMLFYGKVHQYFAILRSLFVPPDPPYLPGIFSEGTVKWTSMSGYLPLVSMSGVLAWCRARRRSPHRRILAVCLVMALVPILNSAFYAFNSSYYARWYYMPVLLMALASANAVEDADVDLVGGIRLTAILTAAFAVFGLVPAKNDDGSWAIGVADNASQFWLTLLLGLLGLLIFYCIVSWQRGQRRFARTLICAVLSFGVLCGVIHISIGKFPQWENDADYKLMNYDVIDDIELPEDHFYRIDTYECYDNLGLFLDKPCIRCFNSTVAPSILQFYPDVGVKRDVSSKPEVDLYALRGLLSVEYLLMSAGERAAYEAEETRTGFVFDYITGDGVYAVYRNENAVPMGFTYDYYVLPETVESVPVSNRGNLYLRAIGLSEEQAEQYGRNMEELPDTLAGDFTYDSYVRDCADRRENACDSFTATRSGFTAAISLEEENLVFFSVPYDESFTATVNGKETEVLNVDGGLIAIPAGAGENEIVLTLTPKWLPLSCTLTAIGAAVWVVYLVLVVRRRRREGAPSGGFVPLEVAAGHPSVPCAAAHQLSLEDALEDAQDAQDTSADGADDAGSPDDGD